MKNSSSSSGRIPNCTPVMLWKCQCSREMAYQSQMTSGTIVNASVSRSRRQRRNTLVRTTISSHALARKMPAKTAR